MSHINRLMDWALLQQYVGKCAVSGPVTMRETVAELRQVSREIERYAVALDQLAEESA